MHRRVKRVLDHLFLKHRRVKPTRNPSENPPCRWISLISGFTEIGSSEGRERSPFPNIRAVLLGKSSKSARSIIDETSFTRPFSTLLESVWDAEAFHTHRRCEIAKNPKSGIRYVRVELFELKSRNRHPSTNALRAANAPWCAAPPFFLFLGEVCRNTFLSLSRRDEKSQFPFEFFVVCC